MRFENDREGALSAYIERDGRNLAGDFNANDLCSNRRRERIAAPEADTAFVFFSKLPNSIQLLGY